MPSEPPAGDAELPAPPPPPVRPPPEPVGRWRPGVPGVDHVEHGADPRGGPRRTSPLSLLSAAVSAAAGIGFALLVATANATSTSGRSTGLRPTDLVILALVIVGPGIIALRWWVTTYAVDDHEIVVDTGLLSRSRKVVPFARLQQIDLHQKLFDQLINTATLQIDTAGEGGAAKIRLGLLTAPDARALRAYALRRRAELHAGAVAPPAVADAGGVVRTTDGVAMAVTGAPPSPFAPPERTLLQLGPGRLVAAAVTHHLVIGLLPVIVLGGLWVGGLAALASQEGDTAAALAGAGAGIVLLVGMVLVALLIGTVLGQYGFTLSEAGDDLHLRFGLLEVRNLTVPRRRIQHLTISDNPLRRALGLAAVTLHTAAPAGGDGVRTRFEIPIARRAEVEPLVRELLGRPTWTVPALTPRPRAAERRAIVRRSVLLLLAVSVPAILLRPYGPVLLGLGLLGMPWGIVAHRRAGHGRSDRDVALARGVVHHRIDVVPIERIQSTRAVRNPLQRHAGLATLHLDVAGSPHGAWLYDMDADACGVALRELPRRPTERGS